MNSDNRKAFYLLAVKEILELFAEQEIGGQCEIDVSKVLDYVNSPKFVNAAWGLTTKEEMYQLVTDDILAGYPVWQLLDLPKWKKTMLERELTDKITQERKQLEQTYKCYTCKHFYETETALGILTKCHRPREKHDIRLKREIFTPKKQCKYYERIKRDDQG